MADSVAIAFGGHCIAQGASASVVVHIKIPTFAPASSWEAGSVIVKMVH